jgi:hypothetical protein
MAKASTVRGEVADRGELGVLVRLPVRDVEADCRGPVAREDVQERGDLGTGAGQRPFACRLFSSITAITTDCDGFSAAGVEPEVVGR